MLLGLCFAAPAQAGLFSDDEARKNIRQLEARMQVLDDLLNQQTKSMLDLQGQIEVLSGEIRKLRGQNEEVAHGLQDAEKRQKDFYVDLDTRVRHFESIESAAPEVIPSAIPAPVVNTSDPHDPAPANRAFESAYDVFRGGNHADASKAFQEFLKKYPASAHAPNAMYLLGDAQFAQKEILGALNTYETLLNAFPGTSKAADTYLKVAECNRLLKRKTAAKKALQQLVAKYPESEAAAKAKKLLSSK